MIFGIKKVLAHTSLKMPNPTLAHSSKPIHRIEPSNASTGVMLMVIPTRFASF